MKGDVHSSDLVNRRAREADDEALREAPAARQVPPTGGAPDDRAEERRQQGGAHVPPAPDGVDRPTEHGARKTWKVFAALGAGCLAINLIIGGLSMGLIAFGVTSCVSSCSDSPIGDSRETASFIADPTATKRDLETFDALRGAFDSLYTRAQRGAGEGEVPLSADKLRSKIATGTWPESPAWYGGTDSSLSPQLWVRLAELSQDHLEDKTGEQWEVVDFAYPFPDSGPVPVPAVRDSESVVLTRLLCTNGEDEGLYATVGYYRWVTPARFETDLDEVREKLSQRRETCAQLEDTGLIGGRRYVLAGNDLYVWERGEDDPLREPAAFIDFAHDAAKHIGGYAEVSLLARDTPLHVAYDPLSRDFPNERDPEEASYEEGRERIMLAGYTLDFDCASGDVLLGSYVPSDRKLEEGELRGTLSARAAEDVRVPAMARGDECVFDEELCGVVAGELGIPDTDVIVLSEWKTTEYEGSKVGFADDSMSAWVIVPRGSLTETPEGFCAAINGIRDAFWHRLEIVDTHRTSVYVRLYEIDDTALLTPEGEPCSFGDLRAAMEQDCSEIRSYEMPILLGSMSSGNQWAEDDEPSWYDTSPEGVGGSIARSRDWRYEKMR